MSKDAYNSAEFREKVRGLDKELHKDCFLRDKKQADIDLYIKEQVTNILTTRELSAKEVHTIANYLADTITLAVNAGTVEVPKLSTKVKILLGIVTAALIGILGILLKEVFS